jgi:hypothetical protein
MKDRLEVEKAENGYQVTVWKEDKDEEKESDYGYVEPKKYVATDAEEVMKLVKKHLP